MLKAVFLDFYGTLVHEDDDILPAICEQIRANAESACTANDIGNFWWQSFSRMFQQSSGELFKPQRKLGMESLQETLLQFRSSCNAEDIIGRQFDHWEKPVIYEDTKPFLEALRPIPVYILSNIDSADLHAAASYHGLQVTEMITSEDVRSYKPRPELFQEALHRGGLAPSEVIHIGDSLISDVGGAQQLGIPVIWLNRLNKPLPNGMSPDYVCRNLEEALAAIREAAADRPQE